MLRRLFVRGSLFGKALGGYLVSVVVLCCTPPGETVVLLFVSVFEGAGFGATTVVLFSVFVPPPPPGVTIVLVRSAGAGEVFTRASQPVKNRASAAKVIGSSVFIGGLSSFTGGAPFQWIALRDPNGLVAPRLTSGTPRRNRGKRSPAGGAAPKLGFNLSAPHEHQLPLPRPPDPT
jgi:hypothetical protein